MKKIMPCLDTRDGKLVKGVKFEINKEFEIGRAHV